MRRALSAAAAAFLLVFAACDTDPATDVTYSSATLHGQAKCSTGTYSGRAWFELSKDGGPFVQAGPDLTISCADEPGLEKDLPPTTVGDLDHDSHYRYRLMTEDNGHWYDSEGTKDGVVYDEFDTDTFPTVNVKAAGWLRDAIGMNTRTGYSDQHGNFTKVREALDYMGVRHVRDSLWPSQFTAQRNFLVSLAQAGITGTVSPHYFGSFTINPCSTPNIAAFVSRLENDAALRAFVERVDSTNEPSNDSAWQTCERTYQQNLYAAVKGSPELADRPVLAPSLFANATAGDLDAWSELGNFHPYPNAFPPESEGGAAALQWNLDNVCHAYTSDPCQATEYGYHTDLSAHSGHVGVSEQVRPTYTLRGILELYRRGVRRVDLYTVVSGTCTHGNGAGGESGDFGFYDCHWNKLPVADALRNFTQAVGDGVPTLAPLAFRQDAGPTDLRRLVFRQDDGDYVIALWRTPSVWNRDTQQPISVPAANVSVTLPDADTVDAVRPVAGTTAPLTITNDQVTVGVNGDPVLLVVTPEP